MNPFSEVLEILGGNSEHFRNKAAEQERIAYLARCDGDVFYAAQAEAKAAQFRQKAREIEAKIP